MASHFARVTENSNSQLIIQLLGYNYTKTVIHLSVCESGRYIYSSVNMCKNPLLSKLMYTVLGRLDYQPLFGKGARAPPESGGNRAYVLG